MKLEASQAHIENERIHREFDLREAKTEALIRHQQQSYDLLMRLRIELDMMTIATDIQEKNILKAIQQNQKTEREVITTSTRVQQLRDQVSALDIAYKGKQSLEEEIKRVRGHSADLVKQARTLKRSSVKLAEAILSECLVIGDKSRVQLSKQITQQLSELSTDDNRAETPTTKRIPTTANLYSGEVDFGFANEAAVAQTTLNFDNLWRQSRNGKNSGQKKTNPSLSVSMMFG